MGLLSELQGIAAWAEDLPPPVLERAEQGLSLREVPAGGMLCHMGDPLDHWFGIASGLVKLSVVSAEGKPLTLAGVPSGGWFGEGAVLRDTVWRYSVVAMRDTTAVLMRRATFFWLLENSLPFNRFIIDQLNERLAQFVGSLEAARIFTARERVPRSLALLYNPRLYPGIDRRLHLSQEELGYLAGVSRQVANQALQQLKAQGIVSIAYGKVTVLDFDALRKFLD